MDLEFDIILVSNFNNIDVEKWDAFVKNHPKGNVFQTSSMYLTYLKSNKYEPLVISAFDHNNDIIGIQVSVEKKIYNNYLGVLTSRSIIYGGPLILNDDRNVLDAILKEYKSQIKMKSIFSEYRNLWDWGDLKNVFKDNNFIFKDHLDILFQLEKDEKLLYSEMKPVRRKGINKAYKMGVVIDQLDLRDKKNLKSTYSIIKSVYNRIKLPLPDIDFFENMVENFNQNMLCIGLYVNEELVAVRIALCYNHLIYDWYAGAIDDYLNYRPNDVLPWEIMKWGIDNNYKTFDFGGAGKPNKPYGVRDYKMKFGGDLVNFGRFEIVHKPNLMKIAKSGFKLKQILGIK